MPDNPNRAKKILLITGMDEAALQFGEDVAQAFQQCGREVDVRSVSHVNQLAEISAGELSGHPSSQSYGAMIITNFSALRQTEQGYLQESSLINSLKKIKETVPYIAVYEHTPLLLQQDRQHLRNAGVSVIDDCKDSPAELAGVINVAINFSRAPTPVRS